MFFIDQYLFANSPFGWVMYAVLKTSFLPYLILILPMWVTFDLVIKKRITQHGKQNLVFTPGIMLFILLVSQIFIIAGSAIYVGSKFLNSTEFITTTLQFAANIVNFVILSDILDISIFLALMIPLVFKKIKTQSVGLNLPPKGLKSTLIIVLLGFGVLITFNTLWNFVYSMTQEQEEIYQKIRSFDTYGKLLFIMGAVILTPIVEELFFRGYLYSALRERIGVPFGLLIGSALFAIMHGKIDMIIPFFFAGCVLTYIYERSKTIYSTILLHAIYSTVLLRDLYI